MWTPSIKDVAVGTPSIEGVAVWTPPSVVVWTPLGCKAQSVNSYEVSQRLKGKMGQAVAVQ